MRCLQTTLNWMSKKVSRSHPEWFFPKIFFWSVPWGTDPIWRVFSEMGWLNHLVAIFMVISSWNGSIDWIWSPVEPGMFFFNEPFWGVYLLTSLQLHVWFKNQYILCGGFKCVHLQMQIRIARTVSCQELTPQNTRPLYFQEYLILYTKIHLFNPQIRQVVVRSLESSLRIFKKQTTRHELQSAVVGFPRRASSVNLKTNHGRGHGLPTEKWMVERNWWRFFSAVFFLGIDL